MSQPSSHPVADLDRMTVRPSRSRFRSRALRLLPVLIPMVVWAQPTILTSAGTPPERVPMLPKPTGTYGAGTVTFHWTDWKRRGTRDTAGPREVVGQLWYPAIERPGPTAFGRYAPLVPELARELTYAVPWSRPSSSGPFPMVVLCPGRGVPRFAYTAIAEDLASHGIAVLGLDLPLIGRVFMPDGRIIPASPLYRMPPGLISGPYAEVDRFFEGATASGRADIAFALSSLRTEFRARSWFSNLIDWQRLGAFGHSLGGRICGAAVADDARFRAFASMEGVPPRAERRAGFGVPVLLAVGAGFPESALENLREMVPKRRARVDIVRLSGFTHNAMTDDVVTDSASVGAALSGSIAIDRTRQLLRGFFADAFMRSVSRNASVGANDAWMLPSEWGTTERQLAPRSGGR